MLRLILSILLFSFFLVLQGQDARLPADLRQHNLTTYNASLFNPAFSLDRNNANSLAYWVRWQWQAIDGNPTTQFLNYTRKLNNKSTVGAAFFQQNTGIYFDTGGVVNYAQSFDLNESVKLGVGVNIFGFQQSLADDRFTVDPDFPLPQSSSSADDFILQVAPGISLSVERLTLGFASENLIDYNFTEREANTEKEDKVFMGLVSYDFPLTLGTAMNAFLRPSMYLRTIPGEPNQIGFNTLLNTNKYWGQLGYNNFYGYGVGVGATFFKHLSLGALVEFGADSSISSESSFELMAAYFFGKPEERHTMVGYVAPEENELERIESAEEAVQDDVVEEEVEEAEELAEISKAVEKEAKREEKRRRKIEKMAQDSVIKAEKEAALALKKEQKRLKKEVEEQIEKEEALAKAGEKEEKTQGGKQDAKAQEAEQIRKLDSINQAKREAAIAAAQKLAEEKRKAEAAKAAKEKAEEEVKLAQRKEVVTPRKGEKYEEVQTEEGLAPGYYLIANVFGTKKYFEAFMADMKSKGLQPKSFVRSKNKYNYVYLGRYDTMGQARQARDGKFDGKYAGNTWIFRVVGE
ncbi:PorP/SprF family type IX secretion system membrane protein [Zobellia uliginosa]|uniref:PorP/SprF family type IX secretion system membrane protein n=1 Tax=Zobellia uliginosa TaxID=143224 RepID=UPI0026E2D50C|nr:PorP/SprF family type IX secretion system membrane protein [Zobellia uliginosa]MDO6517047.1 PorP/SprF family type IX secretion system membrane protein [Zobellia uliginosa]